MNPRGPSAHADTPPRLIRSLEEWYFYAPPQKGLQHWVNGYSAKELARTWFPDSNRITFPRELRSLLESHPCTTGFKLKAAQAEFESAFDKHSKSIGRGTAHLDLLLVGDCRGVTTIIGIEAKSAENFGCSEVGEYFDRMEKKRRSAIPRRIDSLCKCFFGETISTKPALRSLWYQLLTGVAGTLAEAKRRRAKQAVFVVHVFESRRVLTSKSKIVNDHAFADFLRALGLATGENVPAGTLFHKNCVAQPTEFIPSIPFSVGKCSRDISPLLDAILSQPGDDIADVEFLGTNGKITRF